jgi:uncharacterized protein
MTDSVYIIRFNHLAEGIHEYDFNIDDSFFAKREESIIKQAKVNVKVTLHKDSGGMHLDLSMIGDVAVDCVRCLEGFRMPVEIEKSLLVKMVDEVNEEYDDEDEIYISKKAIEIDLSHSLYDFLTLEIPYCPVHPEDENGVETCNPEVLKHIKKQETKIEEKDNENEGDARWLELKKIKLN